MASSDTYPPTPAHVQPHGTQVRHHSTLPLIPTQSLLDSVASASHYAGVKIQKRESISSHHNTGEALTSHLQVRASHNDVLKDLLELYCCRPTLAIFERRWSKDAVFEDPLVQCKGLRECIAQWFALAKLASKSETLETRVMSSTQSPNRLVFSQTQEYTLRLRNTKKVVKSIVTVDLDENERIISLVDKWDGEELSSFFVSRFFRRANAKITPIFVRVSKKRPTV